MHPIQLNRGNLPRIVFPVAVPTYDVARVQPGIVHLGLGGFHRAHMARYTHALMERDPDALNHGIIGAGLRSADKPMQDSLVPQDGLYTLLERNGADEKVSIIGSLAGLIHAGEDTGPLLQAIDSANIRIVSLTVTENGYCLNASTKRLDPEHPMIRRDLLQPRQPATAIGVLVEAYHRRKTMGQPAFTALSCDNIQHNGAVLRGAVLDFARLRDPALADWIEANASFPSTMVDRITPLTTPADKLSLQDRYGIADNWPVVCETFTQWIIEDRFPTGRPSWQDVGAQFVADVTPYEAMKLRLLNASHLAVSALGRLAGMTYVDETMREPLLRAYMVGLMDRETGPTLDALPDVDLPAYKRTLVERFANTAIKDTVERVNTDAPVNLLTDPIAARLAAGQSIELLALALAAWLCRMRAKDDLGQPIEVRHPMASELRERAAAGGPDPRPLLGIEPLFGSLGRDPRLITPVAAWLASLYQHGSLNTLRRAAAELAF
jgi:mannitol 2-dehydrogenase